MKNWNDKELMLLKSKFYEYGSVGCSLLLGSRSINACRQMAKVMKLESKFKRTNFRIIRRFENFFTKQDGCWNWNGTIDEWGYGVFRSSGENILAHRYSYEKNIGEIYDGLFVCHKCDNPRCVNPSHFFLGTTQDNMNDMKAKGRASKMKRNKNPQSKLNENDILYIRSSPNSRKSLASQFNVSTSNIRLIKLGITWVD